MADPNGIAENMLLLIANGNGYSQGWDPASGRWSAVVDKDARPLVLLKNKALDCSSAVGLCVALAGYPIDLTTDRFGTDVYTGNLIQKCTAAGAVVHVYDRASVQRGDILLRDGHTEVVTSVNPARQSGFRINENGEITGGLPGNQTGTEAGTSALVDNWSWIIRFPTIPTKAATAADLLAPEEDENMKGFNYKRKDGTLIHALFNEVSGFYNEFHAGVGKSSGMGGNYVNPLAISWETNPWPTITEIHANSIKAACEAVRKGK